MTLLILIALAQLVVSLRILVLLNGAVSALESERQSADRAIHSLEVQTLRALLAAEAAARSPRDLEHS